MKKIAIFIKKNFEEIEAITTIDILRRGGIEVELISMESELNVKGSHDIEIVTDKFINEFDQNSYEGIIIPGGPAVNDLFDNKTLLKIINDFNDEEKMVAAICAAPQLLGQAGIVKGYRVVNYPGCDMYLASAEQVSQIPALTHKNIITGAGPGSTIPFALEIVKYLTNEENFKEVKEKLVIL
ncbi:DJ-1 family glyoxalase III [[Acholeplasma] multilocale]|uniref:DJ-1 family glyoxalase III n=1 Tax=[Acholeplasma] multilocale TaxID=264638 RepID=UPI000400CCC1|nr:DJ-1 family glyoxalase III [[Acholeplasma] multilocale]